MSNPYSLTGLQTTVPDSQPAEDELPLYPEGIMIPLPTDDLLSSLQPLQSYHTPQNRRCASNVTQPHASEIGQSANQYPAPCVLFSPEIPLPETPTAQHNHHIHLHPSNPDTRGSHTSQDSDDQEHSRPCRKRGLSALGMIRVSAAVASLLKGL